MTILRHEMPTKQPSSHSGKPPVEIWTRGISLIVVMETVRNSGLAKELLRAASCGYDVEFEKEMSIDKVEEDLNDMASFVEVRP